MEDTDFDKLTTIEKRLRAIEGTNFYDPIKAVEMCLVPNIVVLKKSKVLEFSKYTGTQCLITHLKVYCNKMAQFVNDKKLLIYFFQESLG
jgi:hypothetical protein